MCQNKDWSMRRFSKNDLGAEQRLNENGVKSEWFLLIGLWWHGSKSCPQKWKQNKTRKFDTDNVLF